MLTRWTSPGPDRAFIPCSSVSSVPNSSSVRGQLVQAVMPRDELGIVIGQAVNALLELDETPDREAVEVIGRRAALEVEQRRLVLAPIVQQVCEIDARLGVLQIELERPAQPVEGPAFVGEPMGGVAHARRGLRGVRMPGDRYFEETPRLIQHALAEQGASDLEHEVVVVTESEGQNAVEARDRTRAIAELEQHLAKPRERVFVLGVEAHGFLKRAARPHILLSREPGVSHAHMQLDGVRVEPQAFSHGLDLFVVLGFVVELMRAFVVVVGAQERFRHRTGLPGRLCYDTTPRTVTQATDAEYLPRRCPPCPPRSRKFRTAPAPRRAASPPRPRTPASRPTARRTSRCSSARRAAPRRACSRRMCCAPRPWCTTPTSWPSGRDGSAQSR